MVLFSVDIIIPMEKLLLLLVVRSVCGLGGFSYQILTEVIVVQAKICQKILCYFVMLAKLPENS